MQTAENRRLYYVAALPVVRPLKSGPVFDVILEMYDFHPDTVFQPPPGIVTLIGISHTESIGAILCRFARSRPHIQSVRSIMFEVLSIN